MYDVKYTNLEELDLTGKRYQIWRSRSRVTTVRIGTISYKTLDHWNSEAEALECLEVWRSAGFKGSPTNPASFFHILHNGRRISYSQNIHFISGFRGGWQKTFLKGLVSSASYYYDLKSAYFWAGDMLLPTGYKLYEAGDKKYIVLLNQKDARPELPTAFGAPGLIIADNKDVLLYGLFGEVIFGLAWNDKHSIRLDEVWNKLEKLELPEIVKKKIRSSYWGRWVMSGGVLRNTIEAGSIKSENIIKNHLLNMVWGNLIVHRVFRKMWVNSRDHSLLVMVDAVLKTIKINTGKEAGEFVLKNTFKNGVYIESSGIWTGVPVLPERALWTKHAGIKTKQKEEVS